MRDLHCEGFYQQLGNAFYLFDIIVCFSQAFSSFIQHTYTLSPDL